MGLSWRLRIRHGALWRSTLTMARGRDGAVWAGWFAFVSMDFRFECVTESRYPTRVLFVSIIPLAITLVIWVVYAVRVAAIHARLRGTQADWMDKEAKLQQRVEATRRCLTQHSTLSLLLL